MRGQRGRIKRLEEDKGGRVQRLEEDMRGRRQRLEEDMRGRRQRLEVETVAEVAMVATHLKWRMILKMT